MTKPDKRIDGKAFADLLRVQLTEEVAALKAEHGLQPGLAVVLVGVDPASQVYVHNKARTCEEIGMLSVEHRLPAYTPEADLLALVAKLNDDPTIHGILVQLPLPGQINAERVISAIDPRKDVDGFHPTNVGLLSVGKASLVSCTPMGCMQLLTSRLGRDLSGYEAVVIGRSNIVGKPIAQLLLRANATVTMAHSRTRDLPGVVRRADIVVAAVGQPELVRGDWIKPGAVVIDVGINRVAGPGGTTKLVGDVCYKEAVVNASAITPVPGGVGPMTIICLMYNTLTAARRLTGLD